MPRTVLDCASTLPLREAVVTADHALRRGTERAELLALLERRAGAPGCRRARRVLDLADGRSESPGETLTRLVLLRARLPRPELQVRIRTPRGLYRGDFGWRILRTDWATVVHRPDDLVALVRRELAARDRRIIE
ncbi:hypothetical protein DEJ37_00810 [Kocuria rosea]|nr:hypothetical protein DEJ37_00810 [Kocuria rosea]